MKKLSKKVLALLVAVATFFIGSTQAIATDTPKSLSMGSAGGKLEYISGLFFHPMKTSDGTVVYCMDINKNTTQNTTVYLTKELDAGMAYLVQNGYPHKSFTGDGNKDRYITQMAVWWYLDETTGSSNLWYSAKYTSYDPYNLRSYVKNLVAAAKNARAAGYPVKTISASIAKKQMTIGQTKKYYISDTITVNAPGNYTVSLSGAPSGSFAADAKGNIKTTFSASEKFNVYVPVTSVNNSLTNLKVNISSSYSYNRAYEYRANNAYVQNVMPTYLYPVTKQVSTSLDLSIFKSKVTITKVDGDTNKQLAGATLVLKDANGNVVTQWVTTGSVHVVENLPKGTYTLQEIKAPAGYDLNTEVQKFTITDTNRDIVLKLYNHHFDNVKIIKLDKETNKAVAGAVIAIKNSKGEEVTRFETTTSYKTLGYLPKGEFTAQEVKAPEGYKLDSTPIKFTITNKNKKIELKLYNIKETRIVRIIKLDKSNNNKPLAGATLVVKNSKGEEVAKWVTTKDYKVFSNLPKGDYTVQEVKAPVGYVLDTTPKKFTVTGKKQNVELKLYNTHVETVKIIKLDKSNGNKPLAGATLVVKNSKGEEVARWVTTKNYHELKTLPVGNYTVQEVAAPEGYKLDTTPLKFSVTGKKKTIELKLYNVEESRIVRIIKLDKSNKNNPLAGATLVVKNSKGEEVARWVTTKDYKVLVKLPKGNYTVQEVAAPEGYKLDTTPLKFTVTGKKQDIELKLYNTLEKRVVRIIKLDKSNKNKPLAGATLVVKNNKGEEVARWVTTTDYKVLSNLPKGDYTVEEVEAPKGYKLDTTPLKFTVTGKKQDIELKLYNKLKPKTVSILKVDSVTGNTVSGAVLVIKDSNGKEIARFTTTDQAYVISNIEKGTYYVSEVEAPDDYELSTEVVKFEITDSEEPVTVVFKNNKKPTDFEVPNTDSNASIIFYLIGGLMILSTVGFVRYNANKA